MSHRLETIALKSPTPGTSRFLKVRRYGRPGARPKVYLQAALHADEFPGLMVLHHLARLLDEADRAGEIAGEIVLVPVANPIGLSQALGERPLGRYAFTDGGGNFNRNWPDLGAVALEKTGGRLGKNADENVTLLREGLRQAVAALDEKTEVSTLKKTLLGLSIDADIVLDLHCDEEAVLHLYGLAAQQQELEELGAFLRAPVILMEEDAGGDPFDTANSGPWLKIAGMRPAAAVLAACFATTVELRGRLDVEDDAGAEDARNLMRYLVFKGAVRGAAEPLPEKACRPTPLDGCDVLSSPCGGLLAWRRKMGERVNKGDVIAEVIDLLADDPVHARTPIRANTSGLLFSRVLERLTRPGFSVGKIAGAEKLDYRQPGALLEN